MRLSVIFLTVVVQLMGMVKCITVGLGIILVLKLVPALIPEPVLPYFQLLLIPVPLHIRLVLT